MEDNRARYIEPLPHIFWCLSIFIHYSHPHPTNLPKRMHDFDVRLQGDWHTGSPEEVYDEYGEILQSVQVDLIQNEVKRSVKTSIPHIDSIL